MSAFPQWRLWRGNTHAGWKLRVVDECGDTVCELKRADERGMREGRSIVAAREMYELLCGYQPWCTEAPLRNAEWRRQVDALLARIEEEL